MSSSANNKDPNQAMREQVCQEFHGSVTIVVLGASGDLAKKKTYPALYNLYRDGFLPEKTRIVGYARSKLSHEDFIQRVTGYIKSPSSDKLSEFKNMLSYHQGLYDQDESFQALDKHIKELEEQRDIEPGSRHRIFYMALPPSVFIPVAQHLRRNAYAKEGINRVVVEKPFGRDLASYQEMSKELGSLFTEKEIYRIDHYLGKEMVKNLMMVRFANIFFSNSWDRKYIDSVQITFKEPFGTEGRGGYFDEFGIIRDVMQNHLLQILSLIAMERPISTEAEAIRDEKVKVLKCITPVSLDNALLGQYVAANGKPGYLDDETLKNKQSVTPTFAALVLWIQNERWEGVPFILKAGKALNEAKVEVRVQFRNVAGNLYRGTPRNELVLRIQPDEAMYVKFNNKQPGLSYHTIQSDLDLTYQNRYTDLAIPEAYESLLLDVLRNDHSNFVRDDELAAAWKIFTPLLHQIDQGDPNIHIEHYDYGSRGPAVLDEFVKAYGYDRSTKNYSWPIQSVSAEKNRL
ncbi:glucose-6-phosphate dehydrogenase [Radiomyces spectabilis]|uniref:glucose-6-phosphate dehydrogenase n=1 Tax=Radiomyces spectabilis TaxID=64574 RepID=UPI00221FDF4C|nr:glucose-6-phosphate dehydrogenase [Radiomyces spectabilis]KAI8369373.1 glucose-6-phosphate dehydrogenase [Radiomyces spectabilis]